MELGELDELDDKAANGVGDSVTVEVGDCEAAGALARDAVAEELVAEGELVRLDGGVMVEEVAGTCLADAASPPSWYTDALSPPPHISSADPAQGMAHSDSAVMAEVGVRECPVKHSRP